MCRHVSQLGGQGLSLGSVIFHSSKCSTCFASLLDQNVKIFHDPRFLLQLLYLLQSECNIYLVPL
jgi:hypothetical protein